MCLSVSSYSLFQALHGVEFIYQLQLAMYEYPSILYGWDLLLITCVIGYIVTYICGVAIEI